MKLLQKDAARIIGVDETTVYNWEREYTRPPLRYIPGILGFLGYDPAARDPKTSGEKLLKHRRDRGMTQKELARQMRIDPTTLSRLERGKGNRRFRSVIKRIEGYIDKIIGAGNIS